MAGVLSTLTTGGPVIAILAVLSVLTLTLIIVKLLQLSQARAGHTARAEAWQKWAAGDRDEALSLLAKGSSPADRVAHFAAQSIQGRMQRKPLEAELLRRGNAEVAEMFRYISLLELIAMIAPLLGLLGTVLGMIQSFQELELAQGAANASVLAGGIWQALLTTAAGLIVAIPAAVGATLLSARIDSAAQDIESAVGQFFLIEDTGTPAGS